MRIIAVDWSGAKERAEKTIWLAEADAYGLCRLENGRGRDELADFLVAEKETGEPMVVGLDFAFSFPAWFVRERGDSAPAVWELLADGAAEAWLNACEPPFWGRPGTKKPRDCELFRAADGLNIGGIIPKSVFQMGGAGAVGTASLRGMVVLHRLRAAGFAVWPFDEPGSHTLVEIYPRALTGPVNKSSLSERTRYLRSRFPEMTEEMRERAASSEDAFDAAVSALVMWEHREELAALEQEDEARLRIEGQIWKPASPQRGVISDMSRKDKGRCPFCEPEPTRVIYEGERVLGLWDAFPTSPGHALIVPRRHVADWFGATAAEQAELMAAVAAVRARIEARHRPDGYNVGFNAGAAAGQTVFHLHVHVIPRCLGDVDDPRGGIRWVLPKAAAYWTPNDDEGSDG